MVGGCKLKIVFLYTCKEQSENKIEKKIPFIMASNRIKFLETKLTGAKLTFSKLENIVERKQRRL